MRVPRRNCCKCHRNHSPLISRRWTRTNICIHKQGHHQATHINIQLSTSSTTICIKMNIKASHIHTNWSPCLSYRSGHLEVPMIVHTHIRVLLNDHWKLMPLLQHLLLEKVAHSTATLSYHHLAPLVHPRLPWTTIPHRLVQM